MTDEAVPSVATCVYLIFREIVHRPRRTKKTVHLLMRQVGRPRGLKVEVGFSHYLTLDWISVNRLRLRLT